MEQGQDWEFTGIGLKGLAVDLGVTYLADSTGLEGDNLLRLEGIRRYIQSRGRPYVLVGDFNIPPGVLERSDWMKEIRGVIIRPAGMTITCTSGKGEMLDYAVVSTCLQTAVTLSQARYSPWKPHVGLELRIWGGPPAQEVQAAGCTEGPARHHRTGEGKNITTKGACLEESITHSNCKARPGRAGHPGQKHRHLHVACCHGTGKRWIGVGEAVQHMVPSKRGVHLGGRRHRGKGIGPVHWKGTVPKAPSQSGQGSKASRQLVAELVP